MGENCCCERVDSLRVVYIPECLTASTIGTCLAMAGAFTSRFKIGYRFIASLYPTARIYQYL